MTLFYFFPVIYDSTWWVVDISWSTILWEDITHDEAQQTCCFKMSRELHCRPLSPLNLVLISIILSFLIADEWYHLTQCYAKVILGKASLFV